jgi:Emfourin
MRISFEMSGGLGGLFVAAPLAYQADTADLPDEQAATLRRLVEESGLVRAGHEAHALPRAEARDVFEYRLEIATSGRVYRYDFDDTNVPARAGPLLEHLTAAATSRRLGGEAGV